MHPVKKLLLGCNDGGSLLSSIAGSSSCTSSQKIQQLRRLAVCPHLCMTYAHHTALSLQSSLMYYNCKHLRTCAPQVSTDCRQSDSSNSALFAKHARHLCAPVQPDAACMNVKSVPAALKRHPGSLSLESPHLCAQADRRRISGLPRPSQTPLCTPQQGSNGASTDNWRHCKEQYAEVNAQQRPQKVSPFPALGPD